MNAIGLDFENIHAAYRGKIHRYLRRLVGEFEAEDLTQEVFVRISQALDAFRGEAELSTWIYRIATNAALDRLRSPSFQRAAQSSPLEVPDISGEAEIRDGNTWNGEAAPAVEGQVYRKEMSDCIQSYINDLPEAYRTVLVLSEFEGLKNNEIADILEVTLDTVKIRLHRARASLRRKLATGCESYWVEGNEFLPELKRSAM